MGSTALDIAAYEQVKTKTGAAKKFGECRKHLDEVVNLGYTSLHLAAEQGNVFHVRRLLKSCSRGSKGAWETRHRRTWYMGIDDGTFSVYAAIIHHGEKQFYIRQ